MSKQHLRTACAVAALGVLSGCAGLSSTPPRPEASLVQAERLAQQQAIINGRIGGWQRIEDLAWPLRAANTELCPDHAGPDLGIRLADADRVETLSGSLTAEQVAEGGWTDQPRIAFAVAGSPAARAGLAAGDVILAIEGGDAVAGEDLDAIESALIERADATPSVGLRVRGTDGAERTVTVEAQKVCGYAIRPEDSQLVNASAGSQVRVTQGMLRWADDEALRFILAHEMAHTILNHRAKIMRNSLVTGRLPVAVVGTFVGGVADVALGLVGVEPKVPLSARAAALAIHPGGQVWEREADYVGLYLLARAGFDVTDIDSVFARLADLRPAQTWVALAHPTTPERQVATRMARDEILAKKAAGQPLLPNGFTVE